VVLEVGCYSMPACGWKQIPIVWKDEALISTLHKRACVAQNPCV
jgi:hypothetical protein